MFTSLSLTDKCCLSIQGKKFLSYVDILSQYPITFTETNQWVYSPQSADFESRWLLHISVVPGKTPELLRELLPLLLTCNTPFRIIKNQLLHYQLLQGDENSAFAGKTATLYPGTIQEAVDLARSINHFSHNFYGPLLTNAIRLGNILYGSFAIPGDRKRFPNHGSWNRRQHKRLIAGKYILIERIRISSKGSVYKGISVKKISFASCLIKQGNPHALEDHDGRDIFDRLAWQYNILRDLRPDLNVPQPLDLFRLNEYSFLVLSYLEGNLLGHEVQRIRGDREWIILPSGIKKYMLGLFVQVALSVHALHQKGYIHRDISESNFIVQPDGRIGLIDLELCWSVKESIPNPPFILGTAGYIAPEQLAYEVPTTAVDVYALGALLCFFLSGIPPVNFIHPDPTIFEKQLGELHAGIMLEQLIHNCMLSDPLLRPSVPSFVQSILSLIKSWL